jgi:DNA-binding transcriptional MerR regulator
MTIGQQPVGETPTRYTSSTLCAETGVTYRRLDYWTRRGYLHPDHRGGTGYDRIWPPEEIEIARRIDRLAAAGLPLAWSAEFARDHWPNGELAEGIRVTVVSA